MIHMCYFLIYFSHKFSVSSTSLTNLNYMLRTYEFCKVKKIKIVAENRSILAATEEVNNSMVDQLFHSILMRCYFLPLNCKNISRFIILYCLQMKKIVLLLQKTRNSLMGGIRAISKIFFANKTPKVYFGQRYQVSSWYYSWKMYTRYNQSVFCYFFSKYIFSPEMSCV